MFLSDERLNLLKDPSLVLIFAYAQAGLGHLRVTDALYHGIPVGTNPLILGSQDQSITFLHRLTSISRLGRNIGEWFQSGLPEDLFAKYYRQHLASNTELLHRQLLTLLDQHYVTPKKVLVVATHFSLAHQLGAIKEKIALERKIKVILAVQVTDDSPQHIWYVPTADIIFVPSEKTKQELYDYCKKSNLPRVRIVVNAYPLSPALTRILPEESVQDRINQLSGDKQNIIHIALPISGAAVGLSYLEKIIDQLHKFSSRYFFHIITKKAKFTQKFINKMKRRDYVIVFASEYDWEVVDAYEKLYQEKVIALEITKPSEQAFKALISYQQIGGSILLFSNPVGRQEYDNMEFLFRKKLVPRLFYQEKLVSEKGYILRQDLNPYRGLCLPSHPTAAANLIDVCLKENIFKNMVESQLKKKSKLQDEDPEIGTDGVFQFWEKTIDYCLK